MNNRIIKRIVQESINKILNEEISEIEDVPMFEVINKNISLSEIDKTLDSYVYDKNDKFIGRLSDLHFKYDTNRNRMLGENPLY